jgi:hypothetical protein
LFHSKEELNHKGRGGQTPLMFAVLGGKDKAVLPLLEAGACVAVHATEHFFPVFILILSVFLAIHSSLSSQGRILT